MWLSAMSSTSADTALGLGEGSLGYEGLTIEAFIARPGLPQAHPQPIQGGWQLANLRVSPHRPVRLLRVVWFLRMSHR